jgi:hypothetical protein
MVIENLATRESNTAVYLRQAQQGFAVCLKWTLCREAANSRTYLFPFNKKSAGRRLPILRKVCLPPFRDMPRVCLTLCSSSRSLCCRISPSAAALSSAHNSYPCSLRAVQARDRCEAGWPDNAGWALAGPRRSSTWHMIASGDAIGSQCMFASRNRGTKQPCCSARCEYTQKCSVGILAPWHNLGRL